MPRLLWPAATHDDITRVAVLDTETTGLDASKEVIIELALLCVDIDNQTGLPVGNVLVYDGLEDPGRPIPKEVVAITGITDADVQGQRIDTERVLEMLEYRRKTAERVANFKAKQREQRGGNTLPTGEQQGKNDTGTGTGTIVNTTEPSGSDAAGVAAVKRAKETDPEIIIFSYGVPLLVSAGSTDKAARSFLGGLRKVHGDEALIQGLRDCIKAKPVQPLEWLAKVLPPKPPAGKQSALEARNAATVAKLIAEDAHATE